MYKLGMEKNDLGLYVLDTVGYICTAFLFGSWQKDYSAGLFMFCLLLDLRWFVRRLKQ